MILKKRDIPLLISFDKIWDFALHSAFTDLVRFQGKWFLAFRESNKHENGNNGKIRILASQEGIIWKSVAYIALKGVDLRDPKLSVTPDKRLLLIMGGNVATADSQYLGMQTWSSFSLDGISWSELNPILELHEWLWRLTWYQGKAYGVAYRYMDPFNPKGEWAADLYVTENGLTFTPICRLNIDGQPNETTLQFTKEGMMLALVRRSKKNDSRAWLGASFPPYQDWGWILGEYSIGGPNFIILPSGEMWAAGRMIENTPYGAMEKTMLARLDFDGIHPVMVLPSGGDTGYPGLVYHDGYAYISYYSSHEGKSAIYLVKLQLPHE